MKKKKQIVNIENNRMGLFMSDNSFDLDVMYGRNFLQTDNAQTVIIHKINILETKSHNLYGQSKTKDKKFMTPVTISVMTTIEDSSQEYYGSSQGGIVRDDTGNIIFGVYLKELEEKQLEIDRGDFVEYNMSGEKNRFYEVESANNVTDETKKTIGGFKSYWKKIVGIPVKEDVVPFLSETKGV
ncbi:MAG: hypothetical protein PF487_03515 [Bacteroidales bacterium]|jgi:hypothetical protein|nr:hypothetical protein [Bacteroidales bacterium]